MRIVIATPLFPPDPGPVAEYVKTLATRLGTDHEVTIILYGRLPEHIPHVHYVCVDKHTRRTVRITRFAKELTRIVRNADLLLGINGPSVEVPLFLVSRFMNIRPYVLIVADPAAEAHLTQQFILKYTLKKLRSTTHTVVRDLPPTRPEILPFHEYPTAALARYERAWQEHVHLLVPETKP